MTKAKKVLLMCISLVLTAVIAIGGTIAYLSDTKSDVNVMTLGNVYIKQLEEERVDRTKLPTTEGNLKDFEQNKALFPAVFEGSSIPWDTESEADQAWKIVDRYNEGVIDKFVTVKNVGNTAAYVRTIIAYEGDTVYGPLGDYIHVVNNTTNVSPAISCEWIENVEIEGTIYTVAVYTYPKALVAGQTSVPSLKQVYMNKAADNDVIAYYGDTYDILVISQAVQAAGFPDAKTALNEAFGNPAEINASTGIALAADWMEQAKADSLPDTWDGTYDTTWYNDTDTTFTLNTAEQLAGLAELVDGGNTFEGKTILLSKDMDFYCEDASGEPICLQPIGSYRNDKAFKGTFDGQNHTVKNVYQNTWALNTGYYYGDLGLGLFGLVEDATIKDLNIDGASVSGESALCGTVAATAYGDCVFENITVSNSKVADYQYYAGGIVGWASGNHQYINCDVDESTVIGAQWGDFDNSNGGLIGGCGGSATIYIKDCNVACRIDAYNDVTSTYQWYAYRRSGMLIGNTGKTTVVDGTTYAAAPQLTAENCTVTYGNWANYHYCEFAGTSWPYVRVEAGTSNSAYSNPRYGHPTDSNGNTVVDDNHVHNQGEDHFIECTFDQLYGGGQGVYGQPKHNGVTVIYNR